MMNRYLLLTCILLLSCVFSLFAQVPNAGFENWTSGSPDSWTATNSLSTPTVTRVTTAHSGSYAAKGEVIQFPGLSLSYTAVLLAGATGKGYSYSQRPDAFNGWYQFVPATGSGDQLSISATLVKGVSHGTTIAVAASSIASAASTYKQFSIPMFYASPDSPDTCVIMIQITGSAGLAHVGSYFILDDLSFGAAAAVGEEQHLPESFSLGQNYPNPFNPTTTIAYQLPMNSLVNLRVFNILGIEVAALVSGKQSAGRHTLSWNAANEPSGIYFYQLVATSEKGQMFTETKRATLLK
jgi:hypothetical protein